MHWRSFMLMCFVMTNSLVEWLIIMEMGRTSWSIKSFLLRRLRLGLVPVDWLTWDLFLSGKNHQIIHLFLLRKDFIHSFIRLKFIHSDLILKICLRLQLMRKKRPKQMSDYRIQCLIISDQQMICCFSHRKWS